jgi:hypothetical protein
MTGRANLKRDFGINRSALSRMIERCLAFHPDGRIQGFLARVPHTRTKGYERVVPARRRAHRGGLMGMMGQLFPSPADSKQLHQSQSFAPNQDEPARQSCFDRRRFVSRSKH